MIGNNINESKILSFTSQSMVSSVSNCGGESQDYVKSLVKSKITREFCIQKVALSVKKYQIK